MQEILKSIEYNDGHFPRKEIENIINNKEEVISELLKILKKAKETPEKYIEDVDYFGHIYAVYLLAQFRVKEAYPIYINILRLPGEMPHDVFCDGICGIAGRILASICDENIMPIKELIEDSEVDQYVRAEGLRALSILALNKKLKREELLEYYQMLLNGGLKDKQPYVIAEIVSYCDDLYPEEVYENIKQVFDKDLIEPGIIAIEDIQRTLKNKKEDVLLESKSDIHLTFIDNTIKEVEWWACFYKDQEERKREQKELKHESSELRTILKGIKVRRNDPCPCGSEKKYKKCCGKNL